LRDRVVSVCLGYLAEQITRWQMVEAGNQSKNKHFHYIIKSATTQSKLATSSRPNIESSQSLVMERIPLFGLPGTRG
jgi:hypothetical protein